MRLLGTKRLAVIEGSSQSQVLSQHIQLTESGNAARRILAQKLKQRPLRLTSRDELPLPSHDLPLDTNDDLDPEGLDRAIDAELDKLHG